MKAKHVFTTLGLALVMGLGAAAGLSHGLESKQAKAVESNEIKVYFAGISGWGNITGVHIGLDTTWQDCVATTGDEVDNGQYVTTFTATTASSLSCYFQQGSDYWHPDNDYSEATRDTDKSELDLDGVVLAGGNEYIISYTGWKGEISGHKWFGYSVSKIEKGVTYSYSINDGAYVDMVAHKGTEVKSSAEVPLAVNDVITFKRNGEALAVTPGESSSSTKVSLISEQLKVVQAGNEVLYLDYSANTLWAGQYEIPDGFYVYGTQNNWNQQKTAIPMTLNDGVYTSEVIAASQNDLAKVVKVVNSQASLWFNIEGSTIDTSTDAAATVAYGNVQFTEAGNYVIKVKNVVEDGDNSRADYTVEDNDYVEPVYTLKINDGTPIALTKGESGTYYAENVAIEAGQTIRYLLNGEVVAGQKGERVANNNLSELGKVYVDNAKANIYVHTLDKTLWVSGLPTGGYHLVKNDRTLVEMADAGTYDIYTQRKTELLEFAANDKFQFVDCGAEESYPVFFNNAEIEPEGLGANFEVDGDYIKCKTACTAAVYLKLNLAGNKIYFGEVSQDLKDATKFAHDFLEAMEDVCRNENQDETYVEGLQTAWQAQITEFGKLVKEAKDILKAAKDDDSVEDIRNFIKAYNYIAGKYKAKLGAGWDFLEKGISSNAIREVKVINNTALIIILVSTITVISAAGLFLVIRRRKHN